MMLPVYKLGMIQNASVTEYKQILKAQAWQEEESLYIQKN